MRMVSFLSSSAGGFGEGVSSAMACLLDLFFVYLSGSQECQQVCRQKITAVSKAPPQEAREKLALARDHGAPVACADEDSCHRWSWIHRLARGRALPRA